ncbi:hypothetical protein Acy02nite_77170 [Actinoplanes cyaneus]|uniref:ATP-grasp domain-containing protein n=1 Tax=Actinoplanes cyaneus TaxID=52696 RepID=A0A919IRS3_9ACTN|nr:ATP-grasp domain-containing protein [Actinoplanes cyaneus]MCW2139682.1 Biotin carboxylase [Actinoplanes cyaneus]GID69836.1 hypothetical protein Acy02nite_77170 [Actinoplanes cyaneus]
MKTFVIFELMNQMVLVARAAKARGLRLVVLNQDPLRDSGDFAVPDGLVDELITVRSWTDADAVTALVDDVLRHHEVAGTYAGFEPTLPFEAALREKAGLPHNTVADTVFALDKGLVRAKLYAESLSALRSTSLREALTWAHWRFDRPAILKPANGTGSALCFAVSDLDQLREAAAAVAAHTVINPLMREYIAAHGGFVLEERADGELLSVESLADRGTVHHIGLTGRYVLAANPVVEQGLFFPYEHPRRADIIVAAQRFHRSLNIVHGPTHLEVMVPARGPVELIDFNLRFAGLGANVLINTAYGKRFEELLVDVGCGVRPDVAALGQPHRFAADMLVMPPPGVLELTGFTFPPQAETRRLMKRIGQRLTGRSDQLDAVAMFTVSGDTAPDTHATAEWARNRALVNGEPVADHPALRVVFGARAGAAA